MTGRSPGRFDLSATVPGPEGLGRVHVLAVGGAGMSAVARLLLAAGCPVSGSDAKDSELLRALEGEGVRVWVGHDPSHLRGVDTVVVSSAIREDNPELAAARSGGLRVLHRSQALASLMRGRRGVAVAGANGKTTTSAMLASLLLSAGADPSYAVGGELVASGTNATLGGGPAFVAEADESDGSFLVYGPEIAVVTNVQPDHLDFYGSFDAVREAYARFAGTIAPGGLLVACADDAGSLDLADRVRGGGGPRVVTYGRTAGSEVWIERVQLEGLRSRAEVRIGDAATVSLDVPAPGLHNVLNATGALAAAVLGLDVEPRAAARALASFAGVRRRFEAKGEAGVVRVVDDYAHNPGKVAAVVEAARAVAAPGRLVVVFQPHLFSRTRDFADAFGAALAPADEVILLDVYGAREGPLEGVGSHLVADAARARGAVSVHLCPGALAEVVPHIGELTRPGDLVLTVGAGDVTRLGPALLSWLGRARG